MGGCQVASCCISTIRRIHYRTSSTCPVLNSPKLVLCGATSRYQYNCIMIWVRATSLGILSILNIRHLCPARGDPFFSQMGRKRHYCVLQCALCNCLILNLLKGVKYTGIDVGIKIKLVALIKDIPCSPRAIHLRPELQSQMTDRKDLVNNDHGREMSLVARWPCEVVKSSVWVGPREWPEPFNVRKGMRKPSVMVWKFEYSTDLGDT